MEIDISALLESYRNFRFMKLPPWANPIIDKDGEITENEKKSLANLGSMFSERYIKSEIVKNEFNIEQIENLVLMLTFSMDLIEENFKKKGSINLLLLSIAKINEPNLFDIDYFINKIEGALQQIDDEKINKEEWSKTITLLTSKLKWFSNKGIICKELVDRLVRFILKYVEKFQEDRISVFVKEVVNHNATDNLSLKALQSKILPPPPPPSPPPQDINITIQYLIRDLKFPEALQLMELNKEHILSTLKTKLSGNYNEFVEPNREINNDQFSKAKEFLKSNNEIERKKAVVLFESFERNMRKYVKDKIFQEWNLYARCHAYGVMDVKEQWEEDFNSGYASYETQWNIAVVYVKLNDRRKVLSILNKNILNKPLKHLKFALYIALEILISTEKNSKDYIDASDFLFRYLIKYPLPECILIHILISFEQDTGMLFYEYKHLKTYSELCNKNFIIFDANVQINEKDFNTFKKEIIALKLDETLKCWLLEYNRNFYEYKMRREFIDACIRLGDIHGAEKEIQQNLKNIDRIYSKAKEQKNIENEKKYKNVLRLKLMEIFEFYKQQQALENNAKSVYIVYSNKHSEFWDPTENANKKLIDITRKFIEESGTPIPPLPPPPPKIWIKLNEEINKIQDLTFLKNLADRINAAINLIIGGDELIKKRDLVKGILSEIVNIESGNLEIDNVKTKFIELNEKISNAKLIVEQENDLIELKPLILAFIKVIKSLNKKYNITDPIFQKVEKYAGIANDVSETSFLVSVLNNGTGDILDFKLSCETDDNSIVTKDSFTINKIASNDHVIATIPIKIETIGNNIEIAKLKFIYSWGSISNIRHASQMGIDWFSFEQYLQEHNINKYEFPKPYTDGEIEFDTDKKIIFQGREDEINLILTKYVTDNNYQPIYFHGIRKVGKTSLLNKINFELRANSYITIQVDCQGIKADKQAINVIINLLTYGICKGATKAGYEELIGLTEVPADHNNILLGFEKFIENIYSLSNNKRIVLLFDEFPHIVGENTTDLLDILRRLSSNGTISLIMVGLLRPEILSNKCRGSQFTFSQYAIDFLSKETVNKILTLPVLHYGIIFHQDSIDCAYIYTVGNPLFVNEIASHCISILNSEHRNIVTPSDIEEAANRICQEKSPITNSVLSKLIVSEDEKETAIKLAHEMVSYDEGITIENATSKYSSEIIQSLEDKKLIETYNNSSIRIKGKLLYDFLIKSIVGRMGITVTPPEGEKTVGLFVDYENISISAEINNPGEFAKQMVEYAESLGAFVCSWACAYKFDLNTQMELEKNRISTSVSTLIKRDKGSADVLLLRKIEDELSHTEPDIFLLVTGDLDFGEIINSLIQKGKTVRLIASIKNKHLNSKYLPFFEKIRNHDIAEGKTENEYSFFIDDFDEIVKEKE